jgi:hypothetical protein
MPSNLLVFFLSFIVNFAFYFKTKAKGKRRADLVGCIEQGLKGGNPSKKSGFIGKTEVEL